MSFHLTQTNKILAVQSLQRIHFLWCEEHCEEAPIEKISMLCEALCVLAPYQCNLHLAGLWFAYRHARDQWLPKLSWVRHKLFTDELHRMIELVDPLAEGIRTRPGKTAAAPSRGETASTARSKRIAVCIRMMDGKRLR